MGSAGFIAFSYSYWIHLLASSQVSSEFTDVSLPSGSPKALYTSSLKQKVRKGISVSPELHAEHDLRKDQI